MYKLGVIVTNIFMMLSYNEANAYDYRIQRLCDGLPTLSGVRSFESRITNCSGVKNANKWCRNRCWTLLKAARQIPR